LRVQAPSFDGLLMRRAFFHHASALSRGHLDVSFESGSISREPDIPPHGVALVTIE